MTMIKEARSIEVINWSHEAMERKWAQTVEEFYREFCGIVDKMPQLMKVYFHDAPVREGYAVNGHAHARDIITISFNPSFKDEVEIRRQLRALVFHEAFHVRQGFTLGERFSGLESAVYEGCATIFEREYAGSNPEHGLYRNESSADLERWFDELSRLGPEKYTEVWQRWSFYDPETGEDWRTYKVGVWLVEEVLYSRGIDIVDLRDESAESILGGRSGAPKTEL